MVTSLWKMVEVVIMGIRGAISYHHASLCSLYGLLFSGNSQWSFAVLKKKNQVYRPGV